MNPCWTGMVSGARCHRGGIGCPLPHAEDPPEERRFTPKRVFRWTPTPEVPEEVKTVAQEMLNHTGRPTAEDVFGWATRLLEAT